MADEPIADLEAGAAFRETLVSRADAHHGPAPLWYGWAIMDAFLAGAAYGRANPVKSENA